MQHHPTEKAVFRNIPIPVSVFDHLKDTQRALEAQGFPLSFNEAFAHVCREHKRLSEVNEARSHEHQHRTPALLR